MVTKCSLTHVILAALVFGATACRDAVDPATVVAPSGRPSRSTQAIPLARPGPMDKRYIVVLKPSVEDVDGVASNILASTDARAFHVYRTALKGLAVFNLHDAALELLKRHPLVDYIEEDKPGKDAALQSTAGESGLWGLDRIDQRSNVLVLSHGEYDSSGIPHADGAWHLLRARRPWRHRNTSST